MTDEEILQTVFRKSYLNRCTCLDQIATPDDCLKLIRKARQEGEKKGREEVIRLVGKHNLEPTESKYSDLGVVLAKDSWKYIKSGGKTNKKVIG